MVVALSTIIAGIAVGSVYALIAVCFSIVFTGTRIFNLAQGDIVVIGLLITYFILDVFHLPQIVALACAIGGPTIICVVEERIIIRPFLKRGSAGFGWFIATLGLTLAIEAVDQLIFGDEYPVPIPSPFGDNPIKIGALRIEPDLVVAIVTVIIVVLAVHFFYERTYIGTAMRATAEDRDLSAIRGIRPERVSVIAFALAGVISGLAGFVLAPIAESNISIGLSYALYGFIALAIGGFGSLPGGLIGAWMLGIGQQIFDVYSNPNYDILAGLILLLLVLAIKPNGLFGSRAARAV